MFTIKVPIGKENGNSCCIYFDVKNLATLPRKPPVPIINIILSIIIFTLNSTLISFSSEYQQLS